MYAFAMSRRVWALYSFTRYGPFRIERPVAWEFYRERIRYRFPRSDWYERPTRELRRVALDSLPINGRGGRGIEQRVTTYMLILEFTDGMRFVIDQGRAVQFGETPERLHTMIEALYGL